MSIYLLSLLVLLIDEVHAVMLAVAEVPLVLMVFVDVVVADVDHDASPMAMSSLPSSLVAVRTCMSLLMLLLYSHRVNAR